MKELQRFRQFLNEGKKNELRFLIQDLTGFEYEAFADDVGVDPEDGAEMEEFIASISDQQADSLIQSINFGKYGYMAMKGLNEGAFGDKAKVALENRLTGMAKAMVEDGDLFAEGGNVTYNENDLKDGATPEQIEAIDQIKAAVIEMGGRVNYGVSDEDGTLTYMYLVVDEPPTYDAVLKVITKENNEPNLFRSVFKEEEGSINEREVTVTDEHKVEMLKVAQDLRNLVKTHDAVEGTRLLGGKMQQRDALIKAANTLENLAK